MQRCELRIYSLQKQAGLAGIGILAALMLVVFVAAIAIKQSWRSDIDLSQAGHRWAGMQANAYIQGAETFALIALEENKKVNSFVALTQDWAQPIEFPTDHGFMQINVTDAQSKLNINMLGQPYQQNANGLLLTGPEKYSPEQRQFIRLLQTVELEENTFLSLAEAEEIMDALVDWLDADSNVTGFSGAEQDYYSQLEPAYTMTNGPMLSVSELSRVKGVSRPLYNALLPHLAALDTQASSWINMNTANFNIVRTVNTDDSLAPLDINEAQKIVEEMRLNPKETLSEFNTFLNDFTVLSSNSSGSNASQNNASQNNAPENNAPQLDTGNYVFTSNWFEMVSTVVVGETVRRYNSRIHFNGNNPRVERRSDANF